MKQAVHRGRVTFHPSPTLPHLTAYTAGATQMTGATHGVPTHHTAIR